MSPMLGARVLVGAFAMESNSFCRGETTLEDFRRQTWATGDDVHRDVGGPTSELAGAWDALTAAELEPVGTVAAIASPGAPISPDVLAAVLEAIISRCDERVRGVYLMLHGSAVVTGVDDPEGDLLALLRTQLGPDVPIAVSLDLHAYVTDRMMAAADILTAYRTCPHEDLYRTGHHAGALLARTVLGEIRPVSRRVRLPMITPPEAHDSTREPFRGLQSLCDDAEAQGALAAGLCCTQPWLDVPELGWSAVVTTDDDAPLAEALATGIAERAWAARDAFITSSASPVDTAVRVAVESPGTWAIADLGDATNGGSLGDSTQVLRALLARQAEGRPCGPAALTVTDGPAVQLAAEAGVGASISVNLGSGEPGTYNERTAFTGTVRSLWDGHITYTHPAAAGVVDTPGRSAVLDVSRTDGPDGPDGTDTITVIVHTRPVRVIDPAIYTAVGIDLADLSVVQAKSHVSYKAGFDPFTAGSVLADTAGPTAAALTTLPFTRRPRPMFPFEDTDWPT